METKPILPGKDKDETLFAGLCYIPFLAINLIMSIYILATGKGGRYARFHAIQGLGLFVALFVVGLLFQALLMGLFFFNISSIQSVDNPAAGFGRMFFSIWAMAIPIVCFTLAWLVSILYLAFRAFSGKGVELPFLAKFARKYV